MSVIDEEGLAWLCDTEVYVGQAYLDHGGRIVPTQGRWSFGYGHSILRPPIVMEGMFIDEPAAKQLLRDDLDYIWSRLEPKIAVELNPMQKTMCCSLAYNTGISGFKKSKVFEMINNKERKFNFLYASLLMLDYAVTAKDKHTGVRREFAGLKGRRIDEAFYFKRGMNRR